MPREPAVPLPLIVTAADRPGHWFDNARLLRRAAAALGVEAVEATGPCRLLGHCAEGAVEARVSASHEAGRVGLALSLTGPIGFDLCDPARAASVRSALPLVLTAHEWSLLDHRSPSAVAAVEAWAAVEALAKCGGRGVLQRHRRARLWSLRPPRAIGVRLRFGRLDGLVACAAETVAVAVPAAGRG